MNEPGNNDHWLVRPTTIRWLWRGFIAVLTLTVLAQLIFPAKGYFGIDGWIGFGAVFGFLACLAMVLAAKGLGVFLKRDERYYQEQNSND